MTQVRPQIGLLPVVVGLLFFLIVGIGCLTWPERIRDFGLRHQPKSVPNPFARWMQTKSYVVSLRLMGVLAIACAVVLLLAVIRSTG